MARAFRLGLAGLLIIAMSWAAAAQPAQDPLAPIAVSIADAESHLRDGEYQMAESRYRDALRDGWALLGALSFLQGDLAGAQRAFEYSSTSSVEARAAFHALAFIHLQRGTPADAVSLLRTLAGPNSTDRETRRLLAQALVVNGQADQAVQELEEARTLAPDDVEVAFLLASGYLRVDKVAAAERLFADIAKARPIAPTYVLIGRTYRDFGQYEKARTALQTALKKDPRVRRAHYYLGTVDVMSEGILRLNEAIDEFQQERRIAPDDPVTNLRLGMALVEAQRLPEALPSLEIAARAESAPADAFHYLGRCQLGLNRPADAVTSLQRALELTHGPVVDEARLGNIHYQLALAWQKLGKADQAATHFAEAEQSSARRAVSSRERLATYLADAPDPKAASAPIPPPFDISVFTAAPPAQREAWTRRLKGALAPAYLNLGILQAQAQRFTRAAELFEHAAALDPQNAKVAYSLGVTYFNAKHYDKAAEPLARALAAAPGDADLRRMLALASLEADAPARAVDLLKDDPLRDTDASLQYAYGLALVRSNRATEAEALFSTLLTRHGDTPALHVVLGQAHAQQGDYDGATQSLQRALQLDPKVKEAHATLGLLYLKQGRLPDAAKELEAELATNPGDARARHHLATVFDLQDQPRDAIAQLRIALRARPQYAEARYLLGKILLAQGAAQEAVEHLAIAARLDPDAPNVHYQLGQAYQKTGQAALAQQEFERYQQLKDQRRRTP